MIGYYNMHAKGWIQLSDVKMASLTSYIWIVLLISFIHVIIAQEESMTYTILEDQPVKTYVGNLKIDTGLREKYSKEVLDSLSFTILGQVNVSNQYITVNKNSGVIETAKVLDRDVICSNQAQCDIQFNVAVEPPQYFVLIKLHLVIEDKNDNTPVFDPANVTYSLSENTALGELFLINPANDPDSPENSIKEYRLISPITDQFELHEKLNYEGNLDYISLNLLKELDYERNDLYILKVLAIDGGNPPKSGTLEIRINVLDVNDNNPKFDNDTYEIWYNENTLGNDETILTVHASDSDAGENGHVIYSFNQRTQSQYGDQFVIGAVTGAIKLRKPLDYEIQNFYSLTVVAQDQGPDSLPVSVKVQINVRDVNDNKPKIELDETLLNKDGKFIIAEHSEINTFVGHFSVEDNDSGKNGENACEMTSEFFNLEKMYDKDYKLVSAKVLDREERDNYQLLVTCRDLGQMPLSSTAEIRIQVTDINDHKPVFEKEIYEASISENNAIDAFIERVVANDADIGNNSKIHYMLHEEAGSAFIVDPKSGMIRAAISFDREQNQLIEFRVLAIDAGNPPQTATATIKLSIEDRDDQAPTFSNHKYVFHVMENMPVRTDVGTVSATDGDLPPNDQFNFFIESPDQEFDMFTIDQETGVLYTKRMLDREHQDLYRVSVIVQSKAYSKMSDTSLVEIVVDDKNDNAPTINFPNPQNDTVFVSGQVPQGHIVATVQAYDPDFGHNGTLTYSLSEGNENGEFQIIPDTGEVIVKSQFSSLKQKDEKATVYPLVILVSDNGDPPRISMETLKVVVDQSMPMPGGVQSQGALLENTQLAIIIACCLGIIFVLGTIFLVVFIRHRRQRNSHRRASDKKPEWNGNGPAVVMSEREKKDDGEFDEIKKPRPPSMSSSEIAFPISGPACHDNKPGDSDSGCADVSHTDSNGSDDHTKPPPSPPLPPPPPEAMTGFSDWVHNESFQLQRSGNMYRVSNNNIQRKMVRFNEPPVHTSPVSTLIRSTPSLQNEYTQEPGRCVNNPIIAANSNSTHPLVVYPKSKPLSHSGSNASTSSHARVTYPQGHEGSRGTSAPVVSYVDRGGSNMSLNSPAHCHPGNSQRTAGPKVHFADISNSNKSSHSGNRSVVVPIQPRKSGVTLQGWQGATVYNDTDGSLV